MALRGFERVSSVEKILIVSRNHPPLWGGMERLNRHLVEELAARVKEVRLIAPEGAADHAPPGVAVTQVPLRPVSRFLLLAGWRAIRLARAWNPDLILAGSGLMAPPVLMAARLCGARAAVYAHGLDLTVPHPVYRTFWRPALRRLDTVVANSQATARLAEAIGVAAERIDVVHPGVRLSVPDPEARRRFRDRHGLGDAPVLLSVGRLTTRKGLREFVREVLPRIVASHPETRLVVIGDVAANALYAKAQTWESIVDAAESVGVAKHLCFLGQRFGRELSDAYEGADLHVFPVRRIPDDPEGFGMVSVEAAAHGLATVAYATGGVVDAVGVGESGRLVDPGDARGFAEAVCASLRNPLPRDRIRRFAEQFAWPVFGEKLYR
ncbi:MAG: glycosyltransferase family 4 protein, partial [Candidatus Accumulibacter sp.]|nr:glycosyltransferase family 4 protein [Accumulibacter sp.]